MDSRLKQFFLDGKDRDSSWFLMSALVRMLRTGKAGVLDDKDIRELLANRIEKSLEVKKDEVSDALCITRSRNQGCKKYGNARYDFMIWFWGFMDEGKEPEAEDIDRWMESQPPVVGEIGRGLDGWKQQAREMYEPVMTGAKIIQQLNS